MNATRRVGVSVLLSLSLGESLLAQADTVRTGPLFTWQDAAMVEAFAIFAVAAAPLDRKWAEILQDSTVQENRRLRTAARWVRIIADPGAFIIGATMYGVGRATKNEKAAQLGLHGTEALLAGHTLGLVFKGVIGRARPYKDITNPHDYQLMRGFKRGKEGYRSMPSGHTIAAFAAASAVTSETHHWWPNSVWLIAPAMYGGATIAGVSRMYNNAHWASDVITGAAIGTMAGVMVVRYNRTHAGNRLDRWFLGASIRSSAQGRIVALQVLPLFAH